MPSYTHLAVLLVVVGALNWGLVGLAGVNVVEAIFGMGTFSRLVYVLVGLSGFWLVWHHWMGGSKKR